MAVRENLAKLSLLALRQRREGLTKCLPPLGEILRGSLMERYLTCGNPDCKCARGERQFWSVRHSQSAIGRLHEGRQAADGLGCVNRPWFSISSWFQPPPMPKQEPSLARRVDRGDQLCRPDRVTLLHQRYGGTKFDGHGDLAGRGQHDERVRGVVVLPGQIASSGKCSSTGLENAPNQRRDRNGILR